jgi:beta-galactosidase
MRYLGYAARHPFGAPPHRHHPRKASPRSTFNFNLDWRFLRDDVKDGEAPGFDDSNWATISTPHSFNDVDSFRAIISHSGGDRGTYKGITWYRKHFKLPAELAGHNLFLEFEGMRQAGDIFLNGKAIGLSENGVNAYGIDITDAVNFGAQENVLAVKVDNRIAYAERATNTAYEWNANDFNPDHGGIDRPVWLHVTGKIHQTLPLYYGLESQGVYVHAGNFNIAKKTADITVESEVRNSSGRAAVSLTAVIVDQAGIVRAQFDGASIEMAGGAKAVHRATGPLHDARFWSPDDPHLYDVYTILKVGARLRSGAASAPAASTSTTNSSTSKASRSAPPTSGPASAQATPTGCTTTPPA